LNKYVLSFAAIADLDEIWEYTCTRWDEDQAYAYMRDLQLAVERLADNPKIGRACDDVRPGYRSHRVGSHTLYYRSSVVGGGAEMVRVLHQRMDVDRHLG
jgi:toxin ParE1/3/4